MRADVERVADELGDRPTKDEYDQHGVHSATTVAERFGDGSWLDALDALGFEATDRRGQQRVIPTDEWRADVERVADDLGRAPTYDEYAERGGHATQTVATRFGDGSWLDALDELGHEKRGDANSIEDGALGADVRRVAEEVGHPPLRKEYYERGEYSGRVVASRLGDGSWVNALDTLGFDVEDGRRVGPVSSDELRADVERVAADLGRPPTSTEYTERGDHSYSTVAERFGDGSWVAAIHALGFDVSAYGRQVSESQTIAFLREHGPSPTPELPTKSPSRKDSWKGCRLVKATAFSAAQDVSGESTARTGVAYLADEHEPEAVVRAVIDANPHVLTATKGALTRRFGNHSSALKEAWRDIAARRSALGQRRRDARFWSSVLLTELSVTVRPGPARR